MASDGDRVMPSLRSAAFATISLGYKERQARPILGLATVCHFGSGRYDENAAVVLDYLVPRHSFYPPEKFLPVGLITSWIHAKTGLGQTQIAHIAL